MKPARRVRCERPLRVKPLPVGASLASSRGRRDRPSVEPHSQGASLIDGAVCLRNRYTAPSARRP